MYVVYSLPLTLSPSLFSVASLSLSLSLPSPLSLSLTLPLLPLPLQLAPILLSPLPLSLLLSRTLPLSVLLPRPQITASNLVNNVTSLNVLKTFGFSLSGGLVDVDNNGYNGAYVYLCVRVRLINCATCISMYVCLSDKLCYYTYMHAYCHNTCMSYSGKFSRGQTKLSRFLQTIQLLQE